MVGGKTKLLGILGKGIGHTLSPLLHNEAAKILKKDAIYVPFDMPPAGLQAFLKAFWEMGGIGCNVTLPYKSLLASMIPGHTLISVNTFYRGEETWRAASTDAAGFSRGVSRLGLKLSGFNRFVLLGNGGACASILSYLAKELGQSPDEIVVLRRNPARDIEQSNLFGGQFSPRFVPFTKESLKQEIGGRGGDNILIQTSSAPLQGASLSEYCYALDGYRGAFVDLTYGCYSALLEKAESIGIPCQDGIPMLIEQARLSQEYWWGESASYDQLYEAVARSGGGSI